MHTPGNSQHGECDRTIGSSTATRTYLSIYLVFSARVKFRRVSKRYYGVTYRPLVLYPKTHSIFARFVVQLAWCGGPSGYQVAQEHVEACRE